MNKMRVGRWFILRLLRDGSVPRSIGTDGTTSSLFCWITIVSNYDYHLFSLFKFVGVVLITREWKRPNSVKYEAVSRVRLPRHTLIPPVVTDIPDSQSHSSSSASGSSTSPQNNERKSRRREGFSIAYGRKHDRNTRSQYTMRVRRARADIRYIPILRLRAGSGGIC